MSTRNGCPYIQLDLDIVNHRKMMRLRRTLQIPRAHAIGLVVQLIVVVARQGGRRAALGSLEEWTDEDIADEAGWDGEAGALVDAFIEAGWLEGERASLCIHDWAENQPFFAEGEARSERARNAANARWSESARRDERVPPAREGHAGGMPADPREEKEEERDGKGEGEEAKPGGVAAESPPSQVPWPEGGPNPDDLEWASGTVLEHWQLACAHCESHFPSGRAWTRHRSFPRSAFTKLEELLVSCGSRREFLAQFLAVLDCVIADPWWTSQSKGAFQASIASILQTSKWKKRATSGREKDSSWRCSVSDSAKPAMESPSDEASTPRDDLTPAVDITLRNWHRARNVLLDDPSTKRRWTNHQTVTPALAKLIAARARDAGSLERYEEELLLVLDWALDSEWWTTSEKGDWRPTLSSLLVASKWADRVDQGRDCDSDWRYELTIEDRLKELRHCIAIDDAMFKEGTPEREEHLAYCEKYRGVTKNNYLDHLDEIARLEKQLEEQKIAEQGVSK